MEKKKIDIVIEAFRHYIRLKEEGGMVGNASGTQGAFGSESPSKGPTAGTSHPINMLRRIYFGKNSRKRWMKPKS